MCSKRPVLLGPRTINVSGSRRASTPSTVLLCTTILLMLGILTNLPMAYIAEMITRNHVLSCRGNDHVWLRRPKLSRPCIVDGSGYCRASTPSTVFLRAVFVKLEEGTNQEPWCAGVGNRSKHDKHFCPSHRTCLLPAHVLPS